ncbi:MAG TPA: GIY-YIG nuclease family protein [Gammaproteobacteria bacterium]|nr:GIY-YIG nuclease family protein [Gammaproteobacteria bacterium]
MINNPKDVVSIFEKEFSAIADKFCVLEMDVEEARTSSEECVWHPGVYVWFHPEKGVLKVGRHFVDSRKRAFEHIRDNTGGKMKKYGKMPETTLLLFNVKDPESYHWVAAVEVFLEKTIDPCVRAKRQG